MGIWHRGVVKVLAYIAYEMIIFYGNFLYEDPSDRIGGRKDVQDEIPLKVRWANKGRRSESMFEGIERLLSLVIPNKWNVISKESKKPMSRGGIVRNKPTKKVGFALEALQLAKGTRRRNFENVFTFESVKSDIIFGHNEAKNLTRRDTKDTLKGFEMNVILVTSKEDVIQIMKVL